MGSRDYAAVTFHENFRVMQLTDVHLVRTGMGGPEERTMKLIAELIEAEKPDFIANTGDMVYTDMANNCCRYFCDFMDSFNIPWGYAMGNHDDNDGPGYEALEPILYNTKTCLYRHGPAEVPGFGNYIIGLIDSNREPVWTLYFLDTRDGRRSPLQLGPAQVEWYRARRDSFAGKDGKCVPSMFFMHVPLGEYQEVWDSGLALGEKHESVACLKDDGGFFRALTEKGDARAVFAGHDHVNDFAGEKDGVLLAYGRACCCDDEKIGGLPRGGYLREGFLPGCRMMELRGDGSLRTWVRLSDGSLLYNDK